jgi:hypothetical protein
VSSRRSLLAWIAGLALVAALPVAGRAMRGSRDARCAMDGAPVDSLHAVRIEAEGAAARMLCSVACASSWLASEPPGPHRVVVTAEDTGREVDAASAWFVESRVVAVRAAGCYIHAFATREAAERHAEEFRGKLLMGDAAPFAPSKER